MHCALFIHECGYGEGSSNVEVHAQYSLAFNERKFDQHAGTSRANQTSRDDLTAFRSPGVDRSIAFPRGAPAGMTNAEFISFIVETNARYDAGTYRLFAGPNSNSAAEFPFSQLPGVDQLRMDPVIVPAFRSLVPSHAAPRRVSGTP